MASTTKHLGTGAYLVGYNTSLFLGWAYILYLTIIALRDGLSSTELYKTVELPLMVAQTAAIMEVLHSALGIVRSPVMITAMQVASRLWLVWGIVVPVPGPTVGGAVVLINSEQYGSFQLDLYTLLLAWSLSEVVRYSFFALKEVGSVPYPSLWLRYTSFIVLYPLGVASELTMVYLALPTIKDTKMWSYPMPNQINIAIDYFIICLIICAVYIPGLPILYSYMLAQRKKMLLTYSVAQKVVSEIKKDEELSQRRSSKSKRM